MQYQFTNGISAAESRTRRHTGIALAVFLLMTSLLAVSCSKNPSDPQSSDVANNTSEFGGYTATDESPAFGDPELAAMASEEAGDEYSDPMLSNAVVDSIISDVEAPRYAVRVLWGHLRLDTSVTTPTDWSGSLSINRGAEVVRRVIRFESATDMLLPRTDRRLIEWKSQTTIHHDGLLVEVFNPLRPDSVSFDSTYIVKVDSVVTDSGDVITYDSMLSVDTVRYKSPLELTFKTAPLTVTFTGEQLAALDTVITLPDSSMVLFQSTRIDKHVCPRGHLAGGWGFDDEGNGVFRGVWMTARGDISGYLKGHWGVDSLGQRMFWGKWITKDGSFEGFLRGGWAPHPYHNAAEIARQRAGGWFRGMIFDDNRHAIGELRGRYDHGAITDTRRGGGFVGKWRLRCARPPIDDRGDSGDTRAVVIDLDGQF